jgi:hypothetical protein
MSDRCTCPCHNPKLMFLPSEFRPCCSQMGTKFSDNGAEIKQGRKVGFTGTQKGAQPTQLVAAEERLRQLREEGFDEFHHGACIGADEQVAKIAKSLGFKVVAHPGLAKDPTNMQFRSDWNGNHEVLEAKPFIERDHDIVDVTETMLATPLTYEEQARSGTWTTVRYAKKQGRVEGQSLHVIKPPWEPPKWLTETKV